MGVSNLFVQMVFYLTIVCNVNQKNFKRFSKTTYFFFAIKLGIFGYGTNHLLGQSKLEAEEGQTEELILIQKFVLALLVFSGIIEIILFILLVVVFLCLYLKYSLKDD